MNERQQSTAGELLNDEECLKSKTKQKTEVFSLGGKWNARPEICWRRLYQRLYNRPMSGWKQRTRWTEVTGARNASRSPARDEVDGKSPHTPPHKTKRMLHALVQVAGIILGYTKE